MATMLIKGPFVSLRFVLAQEDLADVSFTSRRSLLDVLFLAFTCVSREKRLAETIRIQNLPLHANKTTINTEIKMRLWTPKKRPRTSSHKSLHRRAWRTFRFFFCIYLSLSTYIYIYTHNYASKSYLLTC